VSPDLHLANALARSRSVRSRPEPAGRVLRVSYDLAMPVRTWHRNRIVEEVFSPDGLQVLPGAPATDGHDGPRLGRIVAAEIRRGHALDMWLQLDAGPVQDELLARAYFEETELLGTSVEFTSGHKRTTEKAGQLVHRDVTVRHLAFCEDPARQSTVQRAELPTSRPPLRGAVAILGPHVPAPETAPPAHRDSTRRPSPDLTRANIGRVLRVGGVPLR
jgi:hypothetical protein